jgi:hypothetical protein
MEDLFQPIFFLVRLPFFLIGIVLWTFIVPLRLAFALLLVPALAIPGALLKGAFSNNTRLFAESLKDMTDFIGEFVGETFSAYGSMFFWALGIKNTAKQTARGIGFVIFLIVIIALCFLLSFLKS